MLSKQGDALQYLLDVRDGKIYVVVDGEIIEIKDAPVVEEEAMTEEIALETVVEEEVIEETPATEEMAIDPAADAEVALIWEPLLNRRVNLLFSSNGILSQDGKFSYINRTLVTMFLAVSCLVAIQSTFLS